MGDVVNIMTVAFTYTGYITWYPFLSWVYLEVKADFLFLKSAIIVVLNV